MSAGPVRNRTAGAADSRGPGEIDHVGLAEKVAFLADPRAYGERAGTVETRETHMSWVFLTERHAYKLKKPVRYDFLDFSTIERRRHFCAEEVRLNRRLAPDVYLEVVPLSLSPGGELRLGAGGDVVEWLVKMRRLPSDRTLEAAIARHTVREDDVRALVERLAAFYREAPREPIDPAAYRNRLADDIAANRKALLMAVSHLPANTVEAVGNRLARFLSERSQLFDQRVAAGRIVEGHGDLRPEHVYLGPDPIVTDCLEFNRALRIVDSVDELAYLAMECAHGGAPRVEGWLFAAYRAASDDRPSPELVIFYKSCRAFLRARLAIAHLDEPTVRDAEKWRRRAAAYLDLAHACILDAASPAENSR